jgi:hypothetical protein
LSPTEERAVPHPLKLTAADFALMPRRSVTTSAHHLSGTWEGVEVRQLLTRAGVPAGDALRGSALATAAPFQLVLTNEKRPARWVRQVVSIEPISLPSREP